MIKDAGRYLRDIVTEYPPDTPLRPTPGGTTFRRVKEDHVSKVEEFVDAIAGANRSKKGPSKAYSPRKKIRGVKPPRIPNSFSDEDEDEEDDDATTVNGLLSFITLVIAGKRKATQSLDDFQAEFDNRVTRQR